MNPNIGSKKECETVTGMVACGRERDDHVPVSWDICNILQPCGNFFRPKRTSLFGARQRYKRMPFDTRNSNILWCSSTLDEGINDADISMCLWVALRGTQHKGPRDYRFSGPSSQNATTIHQSNGVLGRMRQQTYKGRDVHPVSPWIGWVLVPDYREVSLSGNKVGNLTKAGGAWLMLLGHGSV
jgi:hypothetical protein